LEPGGAKAPRQIVAEPPNKAGPQIVAEPQNLVVLLTHCGRLIHRKISKFDASGCHILRLKCTKFDFRWGFAPDPLGELTVLPQTLTVFEGPTSKGGRRKRDGRRRGEKEKGKERGQPFPPYILA